MRVGYDFKSACLSRDGRFVLSGGEHHTLSLWDTATGVCVRTFVGHTKDVDAVNLSADSRFAVSGSHDHTLRIWDCATGRYHADSSGEQQRRCRHLGDSQRCHHRRRYMVHDCPRVKLRRPGCNGRRR